jgi:hypothetical protein
MAQWLGVHLRYDMIAAAASESGWDGTRGQANSLSVETFLREGCVVMVVMLRLTRKNLSWAAIEQLEYP